MYYCKIFLLFVYFYSTLISDVYCTGTRNGAKKNGTNGNGTSTSLTSNSTAPDTQGEGTPATQPTTPSSPPVPEAPLDMSDLKVDDDRGFYKEYELDDWKIKTFRTYVGKNFNKLKLGTTGIWPEDVTKQSIYELLVFNKDKKYLMVVTALKPEGYLSTQYVHYEEDATDPTKSTRELLEQDAFYKKFQQVLDSKFVEPFPNGLPKDPFYQKYRLYKAKSSDPTAGPDLDIM